ncbi:hypothetical protein M0R45_015903 [Rubus argutus]|uniref:Uncharacterized protein n=1 Tax=Rubus argutus TaxID=59490 RepID=A0AAW1XUQ0_RUBAR
MQTGGSVRPASMASENNQTSNNPDTPNEVETVKTTEASKGRKQKKIGQCSLNAVKSGNGSIIIGTYQFDENRSRKELAKMIIIHEYPLAIVDHRGFRSFMFSVNPFFTVVSREQSIVTFLRCSTTKSSSKVYICPMSTYG